jgi:hypothetical protein
MKTVNMKPGMLLFFVMVTTIITASAQVTAGMLALPTINKGTSIEIKLKAKASKNISEVSWQATKQMNVRRYELEKSSDGINFSYVTAMPVNNSKQINYSIQDKYLYEGINYYRLKIVDHKGNFCYSKLVSFDRSNIATEIKVMPAIATEALYIWLPANTQVTKATITDAMGREMMENVSVNNLSNFASVPVSTLTSGMYKINIVTNTGVTTNLKFSKK